MRTTDVRNALQTTGIALVLTALVTGAAMAQAGGDVLGVTPVSQAAIVAIKAIALVGIGYGFLRLMGGRHTIEGLTVMGVGGLGIAKTNAIAAFLGM